MTFQSLFEATVELAWWSYISADAITCSIKLLENVGQIVYTLIHKVRLVPALPARNQKFYKGPPMNLFRNIAGIAIRCPGCIGDSKSVQPQSVIRLAASHLTSHRLHRPPRRRMPMAFFSAGCFSNQLIKPNRTNTRILSIATSGNAFDTLYFPSQFTGVPRDGQKVTVAGKELSWHAVESANFNVKLFRFRLRTEQVNLRRPVLGCYCSQLSAGNEKCSYDRGFQFCIYVVALNGKEAVILSGDRRMVMDDCCLQTSHTETKAGTLFAALLSTVPA